MHIKNTTTEEWVVENFLIHIGRGYSFITPVFEGVRVEIIPEFDFRLDGEHPTFINNSGSNLIYTISESSVGKKNLAPIDVALIWGNTERMVDGRYVNPSDTAMGIDGLVDIEVPFNAVNLTDNAPIDILVVDEDKVVNNQWDPGERIIFLTPDPYRSSATDAHLEVSSTLPIESLIWPAEGDSILIYTIRPLKNTDIFTFRTTASEILSIEDKTAHLPGLFEIYQNYPNPFNPNTKVGFHIPENGKVNVSIYNVLGQKVETLVNGHREKGFHSVEFNGNSLASGMYFYVVRFNDQYQSKKMLLIK